MIKSMTGYGRGECIYRDWKCTVEIKAVNHRFCDVSIRLPAMMNPFEDRIRKIFAKEIDRGKVDAFVSIESLEQKAVKIEVNQPVVEAYFKAFSKITESLPIKNDITLDMLTSKPDVFTIDKSVTDDTKNIVWESLEGALKEALSQFSKMRASEGKALYDDIKSRHNRIIELVEKVKKRKPIAEQAYKKRIQERIEEVTQQMPDATIDESRMLIELALYADRTCVDEEITRLESHLEQLNKILSEPNAVGRKLDFLVQEFNREANTIGSKNGDAELSKIVIDMKSEIEKIREQVQNVE